MRMPPLALVATLAAAALVTTLGADVALAESASNAESPSSTARTVSSPLVSAVTISGSSSRLAHIELEEGTLGEVVSARIDKTGETSDTAAFDADGLAAIDIVVAHGSVSLVEFTVRAEQTALPFEFETIVNDSATIGYAPRFESIRYSDQPALAHVVLKGLLPNSVTKATNKATGFRPDDLTSDATGHAAFDIPLRPGTTNLLIFTTQGPDGFESIALNVDGDQPESTGPVPESPRIVKTTDPTAGTTTIRVSGRPHGVLTLQTHAGTLASARSDDTGAAEFTIFTPRHETLMLVSETVDGGAYASAPFVVADGLGSLAPPIPSVAEGSRSDGRVLLEITGEAGTTTRVTTGGALGRVVGLRLVPTTGQLQMALPLPSSRTTYTVITTRSGGTSSREAIITIEP